MQKKKLVVFSIYNKIMDVYRGLREDNWDATREYVGWGDPRYGVAVDSPFIVVDEDTDIKSISQSEVISFMLDIMFKQFAIESEKEIMAGFYSKTMDARYGFELKDQGNLTQQLLLLTLSEEDYGLITWKTEDKGIMGHTKEQFIAICKEGEEYKRGKMNLYWKLKKHLNDTVKTFKDLDGIGDYKTEIDKMLNPPAVTV